MEDKEFAKIGELNKPRDHDWYEMAFWTLALFFVLVIGFLAPGVITFFGAY